MKDINNNTRIPQPIVDMLNEQIDKENNASFSYLAKAVWCEKKGFQGAASFLYTQAEDERTHMLKIVNYLTELDAEVILPATQSSETTYPSLQEIFKDVLQSEILITTSIHKIITATLTHQDYRTFSFLQWFLQEQREEERIAQRAIELFDIIGTKAGTDLYTLDQAIGKIIEKDNKNEA